MGGETILLVEDGPRDEALAPRVLRKRKTGSEFALARDEAEGAHCLHDHGASDNERFRPLPRLVLLDVKLPWQGCCGL